MMKLLTASLFLYLSMSTLFPQSNYISFQGGYHFGAPTGNLNSANISFSGATIDLKGNKEYLSGTLGGGIPLQLTYGHMFNENIGIELGFNYLFGSSELLGKVDSIRAKAEAYTSQLRLTPQLVIKHKAFYLKAGLIIPITGKTTLNLEGMNENPFFDGTNNPVAFYENESVIDGVLTVGFVGSIGYEYHVNTNFSVFGEGQFFSLSIKSKSTEFTYFKIDGVDFKDNEAVMSGLNLAKKITYENSLSISEQADVSKDLAFKRDFSSFGINLGVKYKF